MTTDRDITLEMIAGVVAHGKPSTWEGYEAAKRYAQALKLPADEHERLMVLVAARLGL